MYYERKSQACGFALDALAGAVSRNIDYSDKGNTCQSEDIPSFFKDLAIRM